MPSPAQESNGTPTTVESVSYPKLFCAAALGALFLAIGDVLNNSHAATTLKIGELLKQHIYSGIDNAGLFALVVIMLLGIAVCWIHEPKTRIDAFSRGFSVFAILTVATPFEPAPEEVAQADQVAAPVVGWSLIAPAMAQVKSGERGQLRLRIDSPTSKAPATANVTVRDPATARVLMRRQVSDGTLETSLPAGAYRIEIEADGYRRGAFETEVRSGAVTDYRFELARSPLPLGIQRLFAPAELRVK